jgi:hypothetical protein
MKCSEDNRYCCIHNTSFSLQLMSVLNNLEHLILVSFYSLVQCNTLAHLAHLHVKKKMNYFEYVHRIIIHLMV